MNWLPFALMILIASPLALRAESAGDARQAAGRIDEFLEAHWQRLELKPAPPVDDATFIRRITLDLAGRVPTTGEVDEFLKEKSTDKRQKSIERLMRGSEFPLHFGNVLDEMIQGRYAGNTEFVDYLRKSLRERKAWDALFRELMVGPWENEADRVANRFIYQRAKNLDALTVDATRVFFGVDISCAKCHDHPLVDDWKQDHFYGMSSFFNRTTGGNGKVGEKKEGEVKFLGADGQEKTARMMFLTGTVVDEPADGGKQKPSRESRREQLVETALREQAFFSRSFVNRVWEYFFGSGLVDPVDQIHSGNPASVDGLLEWLAGDFAASGYDISRLVEAIVSTRVYALDSRITDESAIPPERAFAAARLRPLTRQQLAISLLLVTGDGSFGLSDKTTSRAETYLDAEGFARVRQYLALEAQAAELTASFDPRLREFQSSAAEALYMSNNEAVQKLVRAEGENLTARLSRLTSSGEVVEAAAKTVLSRSPTPDEKKQLADWFDAQEGERAAVCGRLVWALLASAEFRFNH